jgi:hypothetical protein
MLRNLAAFKVVGEVPSDVKRFEITVVSDWHLLLKLIRRKVFVWIFSRRLGARLEHIEKSHETILWISLCAPSLGDVLMDVSARNLLHGRTVDLLTSPLASELLSDDSFFDRVTSSISEVMCWNQDKKYDLVILDSFSSRSIKAKCAVCPGVPVVSLFEYVNGFEVHRIKYSFARMRYLLKLEAGEIHLPELVCKNDDAVADAGAPDIAIAVGGNWAFRDYGSWFEVVEAILQKFSGMRIELVGSENGEETAEKIVSSFPMVRSGVGQLSIVETAALIEKAKVFVGADGGLWHVSWSVGVSSVCLFSKCDLFDRNGNRVTRDVDEMRCVALYGEETVDDIPVETVVEAVVAMYQQGEMVGQGKTRCVSA